MNHKTCSAPHCDRTVAAQSLCMKHYQQKRRNGTLKTPNEREPICSVTGCVNLAKSRGYCNKHYDYWYRHGNAEYDKTPMPEQICQVFDCQRNCKSRGLCARHYSRYYYHFEKQHVETVDEFIRWDKTKRQPVRNTHAARAHY